LDLDNFILRADPVTVFRDLRGSAPEAVSLIWFADTDVAPAGLHHRQRLSAELAALLSVSINRRVNVPQEVSVSVPQISRVLWMPYQQMVDREVLGPIPEDARTRIEQCLRAVGGLVDHDAEVIGAAASLHHGALLLFDREPRAGYALLVAGIETLSRHYGAPPTSWSDWDEAGSWDEMFQKTGFDSSHAAAVREKLMLNRQLRLKATFRSYASTRLPDTFWQKPWREWMWGVNANEARWTDATTLPERTVGDFLSPDRRALARALGHSYDVRSGFIHQGDWYHILEFVTPPNGHLNADIPLPFAVLRSILGELIHTELNARTQGGPLPDLQLQRSPAPNSAA
jgi:hypothetical protein